MTTPDATGRRNGSDYPHPEDLAWPVEFVDELEGMADADVHRIMRDNLADLIRGAASPG